MINLITRTIQQISDMLETTYISNGVVNDKIIGVSIDSRSCKDNNLFIPLIGERVDGHKYIDAAVKNGACATLWQRDIMPIPTNINVILVDDTLEAMQLLAKVYAKQLNASYVAVTGSNGKTSTKDMIASVLATKYRTQKTQGNHNNEIGVPLTILEFNEDLEIGVVEMGMENLHELDFLCNLINFDVALITSLGVAHLENLGTVENIAKAKMEITHGINNNGCFIYHGDSTMLNKALVNETLDPSIKVLKFGTNNNNDIKLINFKPEFNGTYFDCNLLKNIYLPVLGKHQALNALGVIGVAKFYELSDEQILIGLKNTQQTGLRNEVIKINDCIILNDSYKSNPQSAIAALTTMSDFSYDHNIVVFGDMLELGTTSDKLHYELGCAINKYSIDYVYTIGDMSKYIAKGVRTHSTNVEEVNDKKTLINILKPYLQKKCLILIKGSRGMALDEVVDELIKLEGE
ncbi:MAG: UDP-N-acetylmuramoyl-tripeptide--D-alanyl-D-alanine ligase [Erysipelotrichaceae bacterium]